MEQTSVLRIVIADDEGVIRLGLRQMVESLGYRVIATAANGREALQETIRLGPDLLLLDIKMPEMDGLTVAEELVSRAPVPIVMLTAFSERSLIERAANAAVMGYLVKPIHESKLAPMIELAVSRFAAMRNTAQEVRKLKGQLEARTVIDAAKKILMATGLTEEEAYNRLQMTARGKRLSMREVAAEVIAVGRNESK